MYCLRCAEEYPSGWRGCPKHNVDLVPTPVEPPVQVIEPYAPSDPVERALVAAIRSNPADVATCQVYADWLEGVGDRTRSEHLRRELANWPERDWVGDGFDLGEPPVRSTAGSQSWRVLVSHVSISCCAMRWDELAPTANDTVRFCAGCQHEVVYCCGYEAARVAGYRAQGIAIDAELEVREARARYLDLLGSAYRPRGR